ncbi:urea amidolyase family protein [Microbacterium schleiferi]|uniref:5-oxoprolinase subunit B/C family protein n=1 Tax=Microbacterium schleiferi TaxID=69362 RepID=UPI00311FC0A1
MTGARIRAFGDTALLAEVPEDLSAAEALWVVIALRERLANSQPVGVADLVPAARTVLVRFASREVAPSLVRAWLEKNLGAALAAATPDALSRRASPDDTAVEIGIRYDGPDLDETAALLDIRPAQLISTHLAVTWTVAFTGFAPGFGYLVSEEWPFDVPRLASPRTRVPAGSVGLAGSFSGAYPRSTPGGWRLIGATSAPLFDPDAASPALLRPGMRVRFREVVDSSASGTPASHAVTAEQTDAGTRQLLRVDASGLLATIQDAGRRGAGSLGVSISGALDRTALRTANRLVGNAEDAAGLEITAGGFEAIALADVWIAVTGAWGELTIDGHGIDHGAAHLWRRGTHLRMGWFTAGVRAYLALRGGIESRHVLGSVATDTLAGLGPEPLRVDTVLCGGGLEVDDVPASDLAPWSPPSPDVVIRLMPGPRDDAFTPASRRALFEATWTVGAAADRVGMRLEGPRLERSDAGELPSEGMVPGAIQVPPSGSPTILLADGPVTGGYPVIATVLDADLDLLAQAGPGTTIHFRHAPQR